MDLSNAEGLAFEDLKPQVKVSRRDLYLNRATTCFLARKELYSYELAIAFSLTFVALVL